jgi:hypothetical protein
MKVLSADPVKACTETLMNKLKKRAEKQDTQLGASEQEIGWVMEELAQDLLRGPNHLRRSVSYGWALQEAKLRDVPELVVKQATCALDAVGLDVGAVSVIWDEPNARVTGVTSAPGLGDSLLTCYALGIKEFGTADKKKAALKSEQRDAAPKELIARLKQKVTGLNKKKAEEILKALEE